MFVKSPAQFINSVLLVIFLALPGCTFSNSPPPPTVPPTNKIEWQYSVFGSDIGGAGLITTDLEDDGSTEIIATAKADDYSTMFWYVLRKDAKGDYPQVWRSPNYTSRIIRLLTADVNQDRTTDIVVGFEDGTVVVYNGANYRQITTYKITSYFKDMALSDIDGDGVLEMIVTDGSGLFIFSAWSGTPLWSTPTGGGSSIAVGNVDTDNALEIIGTNVVTDGKSHAIEWSYPAGFGSMLTVGDLNGDGIDEVIGAEGQIITVFDGNHKNSSWDIHTYDYISALTIKEIGDSKQATILYGTRQFAGIHAVSPILKTELWATTAPETGVSNIAWADTDGDGNDELIWGAGGLSTGPDFIYIVDPITKLIKWQNQNLVGPLNAQDIGDVDGDGEEEIVLISRKNDSSSESNVIQCFSAKTHALKWQEPLSLTLQTGSVSLKIADADNDGRKDIIVSTTWFYDATIRVYDGISHQLKAQSPISKFNYFSKLAAGDLDGDGKIEIVAAQALTDPESNGTNLIIFDGLTLQEKWRTTLGVNPSGETYDLQLVDLNGNGDSEILVSIPGLNKVIAYDGITHSQLWQTDSPAYALDIANIDSDTAKEILVGRVDGKIDVYSSVDFSFKQTITTPSTKPIYALHVEEINQDGQLDWLMTSGDTLYALDPTHPEKALWQQGGLSEHLGWHNQMVVKDINHDGSMKLVVGSDFALYQFGL